MLTKHLNTSSNRGKVNNYNCDHTLVTSIDDGSHPSTQSEPSRRLVNAAAVMSLRPETSSLTNTLKKMITRTAAEPL
ncbi:hypothetical protein GEMRC1_001201 [Eukaryota sp. GEM-RC1]